MIIGPTNQNSGGSSFATCFSSIFKMKPPDCTRTFTRDVCTFWSGNGLPKSVVGNYGRATRTLYKLAGVKNGHAHRWRDTFATELLLKGATLGQVAALLGHQSTKVTEKHYSPWVKARQEQLEAVVKATF